MEHESDDDRPLLRSTRLPPATAASLRPSVDDSAARTRDLREALDELRAELDGTTVRTRPEPRTEPSGEPPPDPPITPPTAGVVEPPNDPPTEPPGGNEDGDEPPGPARARRPELVTIGVVAALAAVVLVGVGVVRVVAWSMAAPTGPPATASASPTRSPTGPPPTGAASASPSGPASLGPPVALPDGLPISGPGADVPGADAFAALDAGGAVDVWERLVVRPGTAEVSLAPATTSALPARAGVRLTDVQVAVNGRRVTPRDSGAGWQVTLPPGDAFTQVVVRYRLTGALVRVTPAPPGRVTLELRPVAGSTAMAAGDPVVVRLTDRRVGAVYCPAARAPLCAVSQGAAHVATVPAGSAPIVLAQLTLR